METTTNGVIKATSQDIYNVDPFNNNATILDEHVSKIASENTVGHIKIGKGLQMTDEVASIKIADDLVTKDATIVLSANMGVELKEKLEEHAEKVATETTLGHIKIGTGLQMTNGVASVNVGDLIDKMYPVGSIYMSVNNVSPADFIGGTWEDFGKGRTLIGVNNDNSNYIEAEKMGGSESTILQTKNIPSHAHSFSWTGKPSGSASTSVSVSADGNHIHTAGCLTANSYTIEGKLGNMITESTGGLVVSGAFSCGPSAEHGRYGGGTQLATLKDIAYFNNTHGHSISGNTEWAGSHAHGASASTILGFNNMTVSGNTGTSGNGEAFSNLQPYITCYMWKRTA